MLKQPTDDHLIQILCASVHVAPAIVAAKGELVNITNLAAAGIELAKLLKHDAPMNL